MKPGDMSIATQTRYFDFETKTWKLLPSMASLVLGSQESYEFEFLCAEYVGNYLYVAAKKSRGSGAIYRYHVVNNVWEPLPRFQSSTMGFDHVINCLCSVNEYLYAISDTDLPQRYSFAQNEWQSGSKLPFLKTSYNGDKLCNVAAVVMKSKIYVLHGCHSFDGEMKTAVFHCFDPEKNEWKQKASTSSPHFGSILFVDNNKLYVAGGTISGWNDGWGGVIPSGNPAPVEVYDERNDQWFAVRQSHVPPNNLEAVEVEGKIYFIINKFPIDSGIRIPPGEVYHISLHEWSKHVNSPFEAPLLGSEPAELAITAINTAALCFVPVRTDNLKTQPSDEKKTLVKTNVKKN